MDREITKDELKRWGFFYYPDRGPNIYYHNGLCMELHVIKNLAYPEGLDRDDFIQAVYEHGRKHGIKEAQCKIQESMGFSANEISHGLKRLEKKLKSGTSMHGHERP